MVQWGAATTILLNAMLMAVYASVENLHQLNTAIQNGPNRKVGFITLANYRSVQGVLHDSVEPRYYDDSSHLVMAVENGTLLAGLLSGVPPNPQNTLYTFTSTLISPRACLMPLDRTRSGDMLTAIDAAIARIQHTGSDTRFASNNPPFEFVAVHTCKPDDLSNFEFPNASLATGDLAQALSDRVIRMGSFGYKPNWGSDGDYSNWNTSNRMTGFWPDYVYEMETHLQAAYGSDITIQRTWFDTSTSLFQAMAAGTVHVSEPYYVVDSFYNGVARKNQFSLSCTSIGYDSTFFTKRETVIDNSASGDSKAKTPWVGIGIAIGLVCLLTLFVSVLIVKERRGTPIFHVPLVSQESGLPPTHVGRANKNGSL